MTTFTGLEIAQIVSGTYSELVKTFIKNTEPNDHSIAKLTTRDRIDIFYKEHHVSILRSDCFIVVERIKKLTYYIIHSTLDEAILKVNKILPLRKNFNMTNLFSHVLDRFNDIAQKEYENMEKEFETYLLTQHTELVKEMADNWQL